MKLHITNDNTIADEFKAELKAFNNSPEKFKNIVDMSPDMILLLNSQGLILNANKSAITLFEYNPDCLLGKNFTLLLTKSKHKETVIKLFNLAKKGIDIDDEWLTQNKSGYLIPVDIRMRILQTNDKNEQSIVVLILRDISLKRKADEAINALARASNIQEFDKFLKESVRSLAKLYGTKFAFVGRLLPDKKNIQTLAVWAGNTFVDNFIYELEGTPCFDVLHNNLNLIPDRAAERYPEDELLIKMDVESYFGAPMVTETMMMGLVTVMDDKPLDIEKWSSPILGLFSNRLAVEIERFEVNQELQKNKDNLENLVLERTKIIEDQTKIIKLNNKALKDANTEMKSFCYSVSHDLRTPLRGIAGFSDILLEDYQDVLDNQGKEYLHKVKNGVIKMSNLIDDMLRLSRVSQHKVSKEKVDLSIIASDVLNTLESADSQRRVKIFIQANICCHADRGLIVILLENLLGNAWKYTINSDPATIEFGQSSNNRKDGPITYSIKDNGIGFNMDHTEHLFEAFRRLHNDPTIPGSGIGLATVKRIINIHQGEIWVESTLNKGTTFYFTIPN